MQLLVRLQKQGLIQPPSWLPLNTQYLTIMGSEAYACQDAQILPDRVPDKDFYGICIPPKDMVFPHTAGKIIGFDKIDTFDVPWQKPGVFDKSSGTVYDFAIYGIVHMFNLLLKGTPNVIDCLYTPENCVVHCTQVGRLIRDNRHVFLSRRVWDTFRGYAWSQWKKVNTKEADPDGKRAPIIAKYGYDVKFAYNIPRLLSEVRQLVYEGTIDLQRDKEIYKAIRRGDWKLEQIEEYMLGVDREMLDALPKCNLPVKPDVAGAKKLLIRCLEMHYGKLDGCIVETDWAAHTLRAIDDVLSAVRVKMYANPSQEVEMDESEEKDG